MNNVCGGGATPVAVVTDQPMVGGPAQLAYFLSDAEALAVGGVIIGGGATPVVVIDSSYLVENGGPYWLAGGPALLVYDQTGQIGVLGGPAMVVYDPNHIAVNKVYYVNNSIGNDGNSGLSIATPWKSITKVNAASLAPGDWVLFNRGDTFAGQLAPTHAGTAAKWITFDAYGTGNPPVIDGSASSGGFTITNSAYHHLRFNNLDFSGANNGANAIYLDGVHDLYFYNCIIRDTPGNKSGLAIDGTVAWNSNVTFDTCTAHNNTGNGFIAANIHNISVSFINCISYSNGSGVSYHGFYLAFGVLADGCIAHDNTSAGIKFNDNSQASSGYYPTARNCISYNNKVGFDVTNTHSTVYNCLSYSNTDANLDLIGNADHSTIVFNTFVNCTSAANRAIVFTTGVATGSIIQNNLFIQDTAVCPKANLHFSGALKMSDYAAMLDYNTYFYSTVTPTTQSIIYSTGDVGSELKNWTNLQAAGGEPHGTLLTALPDFVTRYTDLQPLELGNLKGLGVTIGGYTTDLGGHTRTNPPTPGCYDYSPPVSVAFSSAEIGAVDASTVAVTFTNNVAATNYATGVIIKVNGANATISSATRQANKKIVYYVLSAPVTTGNTITWEYSATTGVITNEAGTSVLATTAAQAVTNNVVTVVVNIDLETNNLTQFSSTEHDATPWAVITAAAGAALHGTNYGMNVALTLNHANQYADGLFTLVTPSTTGVFSARFYIDPNTLTMGGNENFWVFNAYNSSDNPTGTVNFRYSSGYCLRGTIYDDTGTETQTTNKTMTDAPHYVEIKLTRASTAIASDGRLDISVDGGAVTSITGIDNYDRFDQLKSIRWGACNGVDAGTGGTFFLDELIVNKTGATIGA